MYAHLSAVNVSVGEMIERGQMVGRIGSTGRSTGSHLHYEVRSGGYGTNIDPTPYLNGSFSASSPDVGGGNDTAAQKAQAIDQAKSELMGLYGEVANIQDMIEDLRYQVIQSYFDDQDRKIDSYRDDFSRVQYQQSLVEETSDAWRKLQQEHVVDLEYQRKYQTWAIKHVKEQLKYNKLLTAEQRHRLDEELIDRMNSLWELEKSIDEAQYRIIQSKLDSYDYKSNSYRDDAARIEYQQSSVDPNSQRFIDLRKEHRVDLEYQVKYQKQAIDYIEEQIRLNKNLSSGQKRQLNEELIDRRTALYNLEESIIEMKKETANEIIDIYKETYEKQRDVELNALDEQMKAEDKRHDNVMENLDDELSKYEEIIQKRLDSIDEAEDKRDFETQRNEMQSKLQELQSELAGLALDDSLEAEYRKNELRKQIEEQQKSINEFIHDHQIELQKQNLQDMLDEKQEAIDKERELEDKRHDSTVTKLEEQKEILNKHWEDVINNERKWTQLRNDILRGSFAKISSDLSGFVSFLSSNKTFLGNSAVQNLIDQINASRKTLLGFDTGGFTGNQEGIAMLHKKELILKPSDTSNFLKAIDITRSIVSNLPKLQLPKLIPSMQSSGGTVIENINVEIGNMSGGKKGVEEFFEHIGNGMSAMGVKPNLWVR